MVESIKAETFFSDSDKGKIAAAVKRVEEKTSGEIAVMVVDSSDDYPAAQLLAGLALGGLPAFVISDLFGAASIWTFIPLIFLFGFGFGWLSNKVPAIKRFFISQERMDTRVQEKALTAFYDKGLYKTRDDTGVLFFISLFEHKVWILADKGIYAKIDQETLQEYASDIASGIKNRDAAASLCREIEKIGQILASHFPVQEDDSNELSNEVIV